MDKGMVYASRAVLVACILLLTACDGRLTSSPQNVDFGDVLVHQTSSASTTFRANNGTVEFAGRLRVTGPNAAMFAVSHASTPLAAGTDLPVTVNFTPASIGGKTAEYMPRVFAGEVSSGSFPLRLAGNGVAFLEWPNTVLRAGGPAAGKDLGEVCINTSKTWAFVATNTSQQPINLATLLLPAAAPAFAVAPATLTVPPNGVAIATVTFTPTAPRAYDASLILRAAGTLQNQVGVWINGRGKNC